MNRILVLLTAVLACSLWGQHSGEAGDPVWPSLEWKQVTSSPFARTEAATAVRLRSPPRRILRRCRGDTRPESGAFLGDRPVYAFTLAPRETRSVEFTLKYTVAFLAALLLVPLATLHAAGPAEQAPPIGSAASI